MATTVEQPAFVRVYRAVADEIAAGRLRAGDRLPTERSLCASHGVSRATVRRAMAELAVDGLVERPERRRAFVAGDRLTEPPNALMSFTELGRRRGLEASSPVLERAVRPASLLDADGFGLAARRAAAAPAAPALPRRRSRSRSTRRSCRSSSCRGLPRRRGHAVAVRRARGGRRRARSPPSTTSPPSPCRIPSHAARARPGTPGLLANTRSRGADGRLLEVSTTIYRGDRYRFQAR